MKNLLVSLMIILIAQTPQSSAQDFLSIEKGQASPISGFVLSVDGAQTIRKGLLERSDYQALAESRERSITLKNLNISLQEDQINVLRSMNSDLKDLHNRNDYENAGWFLLGVLATSLSIYGASKVVK